MHAPGESATFAAVKQIRILFCLLAAVLAAGCSSDDDDAPAPSAIGQMAATLNGNLVINGKCMLNGANMTWLDTGCPIAVRFQWDDARTKMTIAISDWSVGNMPIKLSYTGTATVGAPTTFDMQELSGSGWLAFSGQGHTCLSGMKSGEADGSRISGYYNVETKRFRMTIDFNMMGVVMECPEQTIDTARDLATETAKYLAELEASGHKMQ